MVEDYSQQDTKAPFNMAIATLMSLRATLDNIREVEARIEFPAEERQRIKIELVKRFYVDSSPLIMDAKIIKKFEGILDLEPLMIICVNRSNQKQTRKIKYSFALNKEMDKYLLNLQLELQNKKYFMPPKDDMGSIAGKMY